ncbi:MAG: methyltransferase [Burkholderiaceae bacterium]
MEAVEIRTRPDAVAPTTPPRSHLCGEDRALLSLAGVLRRSGYRFTCITPDTHARVAARRPEGARNLRDVFGWSLPFVERDLPREIVQLLEASDALSRENGRLRSLVRFATFEKTLLLHSAWPTTSNESVFFGPDTYRFASLVEQALVKSRGRSPRIAVDVGCGTGAGGILVARLLNAHRVKVVFTDINEQALRYARINALHAGLADFSCVRSDVLSEVGGPIDLIIANPPYLLDPHQRAYRHGGGSLGTGLSVRIVQESIQRLAPGGQLILYTASPIVDGVDTLEQQLALVFSAASQRPFNYEYREIDPDVFGSELEHAAYAGVERIAVVGLVLRIA